MAILDERGDVIAHALFQGFTVQSTVPVTIQAFVRTEPQGAITVLPDSIDIAGRWGCARESGEPPIILEHEQAFIHHAGQQPAGTVRSQAVDLGSGKGGALLEWSQAPGRMKKQSFGSPDPNAAPTIFSQAIKTNAGDLVRQETPAKRAVFHAQEITAVRPDPKNTQPIKKKIAYPLITEFRYIILIE